MTTIPANSPAMPEAPKMSLIPAPLPLPPHIETAIRGLQEAGGRMGELERRLAAAHEHGETLNRQLEEARKAAVEQKPAIDRLTRIVVQQQDELAELRKLRDDLRTKLDKTAEDAANATAGGEILDVADTPLLRAVHAAATMHLGSDGQKADYLRLRGWKFTEEQMGWVDPASGNTGHLFTQALKTQFGRDIERFKFLFDKGERAKYTSGQQGA